MARGLRVVAIIAVPLVIAGGVVAATSGGDEESSARPACAHVDAPAPKDVSFPAAPTLAIDPTRTYDARVETSCGSFVIRLDAAAAPETVNSFVFLAREGFYDGLVFHRAARDFVVQGGDPKGGGSGGPGYVLPDEPPGDGYQKGSVAMANTGPGTTGSQFFVVVSEQAAQALNLQRTPEGRYSYSILGQVTEGFETIEHMDRLGSTNPDPSLQPPRRVIVIKRITITEPEDVATTTTVAP